MTVVIKAGEMLRILTVVQSPSLSLPLTERQLGKLCARGRGRWWPDNEEDPAHTLHGLQSIQVSLLESL